MHWGNYLFSFNGRINRSKMWLFYIVVWAFEMAVFLGLLLLYALLLAAGVVDKNTAPDGRSPALGIAACIVIGLFVVTVYYAYLAVIAKRLHDRGRSAWWILAFLVSPLVLIFAPEVLIAVGPGLYPDSRFELITAPFALAGVALYIWGFIELYCLRGTVGENRFGADPLPSKTWAEG
jgi:uncharacterized membrane protein YhaH (DUF805 family)